MTCAGTVYSCAVITCCIIALLVAWQIQTLRHADSHFYRVDERTLTSKRKYLQDLRRQCVDTDKAATMAATKAKAKAKAIIVFLLDDAGWDFGFCRHAHGGDNIEEKKPLIDTPHIDNLAREGVWVKNYYAGASVCTPSRAAMLTGRLHPRTGAGKLVFFPPHHIISWIQSFLGHSLGLLPDEITIADALGAFNWKTSMIGKSGKIEF